MARITVEDCLTRIPNRFELVMVAVTRAKELEDGATSTLPRENDKSTVLALREIAAGAVTTDILKPIPLGKIIPTTEQKETRSGESGGESGEAV